MADPSSQQIWRHLNDDVLHRCPPILGNERKRIVDGADLHVVRALDLHMHVPTFLRQHDLDLGGQLHPPARRQLGLKAEAGMGVGHGREIAGKLGLVGDWHLDWLPCRRRSIRRGSR